MKIVSSLAVYFMKAQYLFVVVAILALANLTPAHAQSPGTPYLGEIRFVPFNFAPRGWALCDGQLFTISQNQALFELLGTTYGGDGVNTFALPNLQGRVPVHPGNGITLGQSGGQASVVLSLQQLPVHRHSVYGNDSPATSPTPSGNTLASNSKAPMYNAEKPNAKLNTGSTGYAGASAPVPTMPPYLGLNCIIALEGAFPSAN